MAKMPTPENLATIQALYRAPDSLTLYGIPYKLREDQSPRNLAEMYREDWIYLGEPGWYGNMSDAQQRMVEEWLAPHRRAGVVPGGPHEWSYIGEALAEWDARFARRNPDDGKIEVEIRYDNLHFDESITITPTSQKIRDAVEEHLATFGETRVSAYYPDYQSEEWIKNNLTKAEAKRLRADRRLLKRVDMYDFGQWRGYDTEYIEADVAEAADSRGARKLHVRFRDGDEETYELPRSIGLDDHRAVDRWLRSNDVFGVYEWKWLNERAENPSEDRQAAIAARLANP